MDGNNPQNQSYWFVLREDQSNVIFSSNNFTIQNPQNIVGQEARYIVDSLESRQYVHINEPQATVQEELIEQCETDVTDRAKNDNFWDRNKIKMLLTLCLENKNVMNDKMIWNEIAAQIGTTSEECDKKYRNLRRTYIRLLKKKRLGKDIKWVHYNICENVFKDCTSFSSSVLEPWEDVKVRSLLTLYIENINQFRNPNCLQKDIWKDIAAQLNTTEYNCYHKFKNLKRTYIKWLERSRETGKLIKWPYHHYFEKIFYNYNPNVGPWNRNKIKQLIDAYAQMANKFRNPKFQKKELWKEISNNVGESPTSCDRKFRNLKQTYLRLKMRSDSGRSITKWRYYRDFESIFESTKYTSHDGSTNTIHKCLEDDYVKQLLTFYLENKNKFKDPLTKKKSLWRQIGPKLGLSIEECDKKFRNLKQTYIRLAERKKEHGKCNKWPYYNYFEQIYDDATTEKGDCGHHCNMDFTEIRRVFRNFNEKHDKDKFDKLVRVIQESNTIQRERNKILQALLLRS